MHFKLCILTLFLHHLGVRAQTAQCAAIDGGCNDGTSHNAALNSAIARFKPDQIYGGDDQTIIYSSSTDGGSSLVSISYSCSDGSIPPSVSGYTIQARLQSIVGCAQQCGSVTVKDGNNCGLGVLVADNAPSQSCFSNAVNVSPLGRDQPVVGTFRSIGCWTDGPTRTLTGGSSTDPQMTVEKCVALAAGFKYAAVEYGVECYWGNSLASGSTQANADCNMLCGGQPSELCGDGWRLNVYQDFGPDGSATTTTASTASTPTAVPSVGSFTNQGCFAESTGSLRLLANGTKSVYGQGGMTVEECIQLADSWQFAGVEYYGECYWGDLPTAPLVSKDMSDCNAPCDGNQAELCGGGNRLIIYVDQDWINPTRAQLAAKVLEYTQLVADLTGLIQKFYDQLESYNSELSSATSKVRKRSDAYLQLIEDTQQAISALQPRITALSIEISKLAEIVSRYGNLLELEAEEWSQISQIVSVQVGNIVLVTVEGAVATAIDFAGLALSALGTPEVFVPGGISGVFYLANDLWKRLEGAFDGGSSPSPTPPVSTNQPTPTSTAQSSSTSTIAPSVTYAVYPVDGSNVGQTQSIEFLLEKLSADPADIFVSDAGRFGINFWLAALTPIDAATVRSYSAVLSVSVFCTANCFDPTTGSVEKRDDGFIAEAQTSQPFYPGDDILQQSSLYEMASLSQEPGTPLGAQNGQYIYDSSAGAGSTVYILDTGANLNVREFTAGIPLAGRVTWIFANSGVQLEEDSAKHGTCMLGRVVGNIMGSAKKASIVVVKVNSGSAPEIWLHAIGKILARVDINGGSKTVASMSIYYPLGTVSNAWQQVTLQRLRQLEGLGVFLVTGSGNTLQTTIPGFPASWGGNAGLPNGIPSLLVVGAADPYGAIWADLVRGKGTNTDVLAGIPSVYATHNWCADADSSESNIRQTSGTSLATATTAGLAAYFYGLTSLSARFNAPMDMKNYIQSLAWIRNPAQPIVVPMVWNGVTAAALPNPVPLRPQ